MIGYGKLSDIEGYDTEPFWVSLGDDVSPLLWKSSNEEPKPPLLFPVTEDYDRDTLAVIMERRHRHITIVSAHPPELFSQGNEVHLSFSRAAVRERIEYRVKGAARGARA